MTNTDAIKWLENLKKGIGNPAHQSLWHYEQALTEIIDLLADRKTESNSEIPNNSTCSKMEQVKQRSCDTCKGRDIEGWRNPCIGCTEFAFYEPKDEPQKHCHRPSDVACHPEQGDLWCRGCDYWYTNEPQMERENE